MGVRRLFVKAVEEENGDYVAVFNKSKHQSTTELWHASFLALAIKKWLGKSFYLLPADSPDIYFLDRSTVNTTEQQAFSVEVSELLSVENKFSGDYGELATRMWKKKGTKRYGNAHLLLVSRVTTRDFNISQFARAVNEFEWHFERIWFGVFREQEKDWTFFEIFPRQKFDRIESISFSLSRDKDLLY